MRTKSMAAAGLLLLAGCTEQEGDGAAAGGGGGGGEACALPTEALSFVALPGGVVRIGCDAADTTCDPAESPAHEVTLAPFAITATEVTQAQYEAATGANPSRFPGCPACPVDEVPWADAKAFCEGQGARLPTEAEWEAAARTGATGLYGCGDDPACLAETAWSLDDAAGATHEVGTKAASAACLYDLQGNVWEWVEDCWHDTYEGAPVDGAAWVEEACTYRVQRGGAFGLDAWSLRLSARGGDAPDIYFIPSPGFRCARSGT